MECMLFSLPVTYKYLWGRFEANVLVNGCLFFRTMPCDATQHINNPQFNVTKFY